MNVIQNILDVQRLLFTWQSNKNRMRYLVGELKRNKLDDFEFSYNTDSDELKKAREEGFAGYPAFKLGGDTFTNNVMSTFMKRLPPRSRKDFNKFLHNHHLPDAFHGDDYTLISHTGIQLPSDGFDLVPDLSTAVIPFDYLMEVAGTRHHLSYSEFEGLELGSMVTFVPEPDNEHDRNAIAIFHEDKKIGFVNKLLCSSISKLLKHRVLKAEVASKGGTKERPLIYLLLKVS